MIYGKKKNPQDLFFPMPKEVFQVGLHYAEIAIYAYLMYCEDRKTFTCHPSYATIGNAVGMTVQTVQKHVQSLEKKGLIRTEYTEIWTKKWGRRNGNLKYTILPIKQVVDYYFEKQLAEQAAKNRAQQALEKYDKKHNKNT